VLTLLRVVRITALGQALEASRQTYLSRESY
jgi:hypothetical protein